MSSARQFCREREYPIAVFFTYSFDALFFERIPWTDLGIGGRRRIVIVADAERVADAVRRCVGQLAHLGRHYVLAETTGANLFHPKLIARLSEKGGRVWIGSGNLTYPGWGANRELATSWPIGPDEDDKGEWLDEALGAVGALTQSLTFSDQLGAIREEIPWLTTRSSRPEKPQVLLGTPQRPLAPQLAERWRGRRFDSLLLCTGSTDVGGEFLAWAHRVLGIRRATVCLSPAYASFDPARLAELPLDVRIIASAPEQYMHAKFYWFSGADGNAAVVGSANCSAAAWLGGNVELVVPYDNARATDFESILPIFKLKGEMPQKVLTAKPVASEQGSTGMPGHRIVSVRLRSARIIEALLDPAPAADAQIDLVIVGSSGTIVVRLTTQSHRLMIGRLPPTFELGLMTSFAHAEGVSHGVRFTTEARWIDNDAALERASRAPLVDPSLRDFSRRSFFRSSHHRIMEAVQVVSAQLLAPRQDERAGPHARSVGAKAGAKSDAVQMPPAINPSAMIRNLNDLKKHHHSPIGVRLSDHGLSLGGVMSMLFAQDDEPDTIDLTRETWSASEPEKNPDEPEQPSGPPPPESEAETLSEAAVSLETRTAFHEEIEAFLRELAGSGFADSCDAPRMVQALAFPLLLCVRGGEAGWLHKGELASVAAQVVEIMFDRFYGRDKPRGLFAAVHSRYVRHGQLDDFQRALGDGTLWAALLASLSIDPAAPARIVIRQAAALASVFRCGELLAAVSEPAQLSAVIRNLLIANGEKQITETAEKIARAAHVLVELLSIRWDVLFREQGSGRRLQPGNTLLWSRDWGWLLTPTTPAQSYRSGYISLKAAAAAHPEIHAAMLQIFEACRY